MDMTQALDVIDRHHAGELPIQTIPLANELGLSVYSVPGWPNDLSGMIKKDLNSWGGFAVYVNRDHPVTRRRFTIAHETAHAILHTDLIGDGIADDALYRSGLSNAVEAQANRLAADILMPRKRVNELIAQGITSVNDLAKTFWVSEQSMAIRLGVAQ